MRERATFHQPMRPLLQEHGLWSERGLLRREETMGGVRERTRALARGMASGGEWTGEQLSCSKILPNACGR